MTRLRARLLRNGDHIVGKDERTLFLLQLSYRLLDLHSLYEFGTGHFYPGKKHEADRSPPFSARFITCKYIPVRRAV